MEQFFYETIGLPYSAIIEAFERSKPSPEIATMRDVIERRIIKVRSHDAWHIPTPRRYYVALCSSSFRTYDPAGITHPDDGDI